MKTTSKKLDIKLGNVYINDQHEQVAVEHIDGPWIGYEKLRNGTKVPVDLVPLTAFRIMLRDGGYSFLYQQTW